MIAPHDVRLVATDLDGTLLRSDGTISARTRETLARVQATGVIVVLVTARPPRTVRKIAAMAGISGLAICCNGALVYDLAAHALVHHVPLVADTAAHLVRALRGVTPGVQFAVETGATFGQEPEYVSLHPVIPPDLPREADALTLVAGGVTKLIAQHPTLPLPVLLQLAHGIAGNAATVTHSGAAFVEISAAGVTKATTLAMLCAERGFAAGNVIAFGDMPNDLPMLVWAGQSYAVANAHADILAVANAIAPTNDADGVAVALDMLFPPTASARSYASR